MYNEEQDNDAVFFYSCPSWPPLAQTWIDRERRSKWPSKEIIREIVSKGCRIVHKSHPSSTDPDAEFRFSFSVAELILFDALSIDQKKCFIALKALIKHTIYRSEFITKNKIDLSSYHLKTIFLWTCETIPADQWQTTTGWARCLLFMIDQLYACLKSKTLPGYFIPECNLMDSIEPPQDLFREIRKLRRNPITSAASFLDSTKCFRHSHFEISAHIQDFRGFDLREEIILKKESIFLRKMLIEMDSTRGVTLWNKEAVLRIFAKWCHQNSREIHLAPWQCLTREMTLFDVVQLDILHGFDVPNHVLLEYVDKEWSADVVCKLACCYSMKATKRANRNYYWVAYSLHFKTLLMIRRAINYKHPTLETIITSISILMRCKKYKMAAKVLESAIQDCSSDMIRSKELFFDIVGHKMRNEMQEIFDLREKGEDRNFDMHLSIQTLIDFSLFICYKYCGDETNREDVLQRMSGPIELCLNNEQNDYCFCRYPYLCLMLEVFENSEKWKILYYMIYRKCVSKKLKVIELEAQARKSTLETTIDVEGNQSYNYFSLKVNTPLCSCSPIMRELLYAIVVYYTPTHGELPVNLINLLEHTLSYSMLTTADGIYFSQVLIFNRNLERAISILKVVVEQEGTYSVSMVIWPKQLYGSGFIDDNLRNELIKSSEDYIVFPSNLYARYLLTIAYTSLGQEENRINNLAELIALLQRYSQVPEFAPMLKIISTVCFRQIDGIH